MEIQTKTQDARPKPASRPKLRDDIRTVFDRLSDDALLDDAQLGALAGRSAGTIKRWRRLGKTPPIVMLNGLPRIRVGDARPWLRGA
jgi:hypothetical protein